MRTQHKVLAIALAIGLGLASGQGWAGHRLIRVYVDTDESARELASMHLDIASSLRGSHMDIIVDAGEFDRIALKGFKAEVLVDDVESHLASLFADDSAYHTYAEVTEELHEVAELHPDIARVESIGTTYHNRTIWAIKVSDHPHFNERNEPDVLFVGMHHAREVITPEVVLYLMNHLVDNYGVDSRITRLVNEREIWMIPVLNADGRVYAEEVYFDWRKNRRPAPFGNCIGVDPNRNYGFMWGIDEIGSSSNPCNPDYRGIGPFSEKETQAIRDLVMSDEHQFTIGISYHSYGNLILFPWGYTRELTSDHETFAALADSMSRYNGYRPGASYSNIYPTNGDFDDWMYGDMVIAPQGDPRNPPLPKDRVFAFTFEVGGGFGPGEALITQLCHENLEPNLIAIEYGDSPYRVWPPATPVMHEPVAIANGSWELSWRMPEHDPANAPVAFEVERAIGPAMALDGMESGLAYWEGNGFEISQDRSHRGTHSILTGDRPNMRASMSPVYPLHPAPGDSLTFWCWYRLASGYMFFAEASVDGGDSFELLKGYITGPDGIPQYTSGYLTGDSGGWARAALPLDEYAGKEIVCRLRCSTSGGDPKDGIYLDDVGPVLTYRNRSTVAEDLPFASYTPVPSPDETLLFRTRAVDADGHRSRWSSPATIPATKVALRRIVAAPNPFSAVTRISFMAGDGPYGPKMIPARLQIFDAAGRLVRTLLQEEVSADRFHQEVWDRTDDDGRRVSSGLYFAVLAAQGRSSAVKLVLIGSP